MKVSELFNQDLDENLKTNLAASASALAVAAAVGIANSPKAEIDGKMYDKAPLYQQRLHQKMPRRQLSN